MKNQKGFTLIELLIVLAMMGIITGILYPSLLSSRDNANRNEISRTYEIVNKALKQYYAFEGKYPIEPATLDSNSFVDLMGKLYTGTGIIIKIVPDTEKYNYSYDDNSGDFKVTVNP